MARTFWGIPNSALFGPTKEGAVGNKDFRKISQKDKYCVSTKLTKEAYRMVIMGANSEKQSLRSDALIQDRNKTKRKS